MFINDPASIASPWTHGDFVNYNVKKRPSKGGTGALWDHGAPWGRPVLAVRSGLRSAITRSSGRLKSPQNASCPRLLWNLGLATVMQVPEDYHPRHASPQWGVFRNRILRINSGTGITQGCTQPSFWRKSARTASVCRVSGDYQYWRHQCWFEGNPVDTDACFWTAASKDLHDWIEAVNAAPPPSSRSFQNDRFPNFYRLDNCFLVCL